MLLVKGVCGVAGSKVVSGRSVCHEIAGRGGLAGGCGGRGACARGGGEGGVRSGGRVVTGVAGEVRGCERARVAVGRGGGGGVDGSVRGRGREGGAGLGVVGVFLRARGVGLRLLSIVVFAAARICDDEDGAMYLACAGPCVVGHGSGL